MAWIFASFVFAAMLSASKRPNKKSRLSSRRQRNSRFSAAQLIAVRWGSRFVPFKNSSRAWFNVFNDWTCFIQITSRRTGDDSTSVALHNEKVSYGQQSRKKSCRIMTIELTDTRRRRRMIECMGTREIRRRWRREMQKKASERAVACASRNITSFACKKAAWRVRDFASFSRTTNDDEPNWRICWIVPVRVMLRLARADY